MLTCVIFVRRQNQPIFPAVVAAATLCKTDIQLFLQLDILIELSDWLIEQIDLTTDIILDPFSILCNKKLQVILRPFEDQQTIKRVLNIF